MVEAINNSTAPGTAYAMDARQIVVRAPVDADRRVAFVGLVENLDVTPVQQPARVIVNSRTGSVVLNRAVKLESCAVAHGNLSVTVSNEPVVSQPNALSGGQTVVTEKNQIDLKQDAGALMNVKAGANLADVVKALNALGANPMDLISILQAMKAAGALRAEIEII